MADPAYPNLGFNPVPGVPEHVEAMGGKIGTAVDSLAQADGLLTRLRNGNDSVWQGAAGDAFRAHFNDKLATDLSHAHSSLGKAVDLLRGWHGDLVGFKDTAAKLDAEAAGAKQQHAQAQAEVQQAQSNPDLKLAGQQFDDQAALRQAQSRLDSAESAVRSAASKLQNAEGTLDSIMKRARELEGQHDAVARRVANELKHATDRLAPHKPGMFSQMFHSFTSALGAVGNWVNNHLDAIHSVLSTIAAVGGLIALVTPPPIDAIAFGVAAVAGVGALAIDAANPKFRHGIGELVHGNFNKESLGAAMTGVGDLLSVVPGATVAGKAVIGSEKTISELASIGSKTPGLALRLGLPAEKIAASATNLVAKLPGSIAAKVPEITADGVLYGANLFHHAQGAAKDIYKDVKQAIA